MDGDAYYKTITVPSKATIIGIVITAIILIYIVMSVAGVVPSAYNIMNLVNPSQNNNNGNMNTNTTENNTQTVPVINKVVIYGLPETINITQNPQTSWQLSFKVASGYVHNMKIMFMPIGMQNVTISLSGDSHWTINNNVAIYNGNLTKGAIVYLTLEITAETNATVHNTGLIKIQPMNVGVTFVADTFAIQVVQ